MAKPCNRWKSISRRRRLDQGKGARIPDSTTGVNHAQRIASAMWIVTIVLLGLAALGLSGEFQQRSQRKRVRRETLLDAQAQATKIANARKTDAG